MNLALAAAFAIAVAVPPFPPPKVIEVTPELVCDWGPIESKAIDTIVVRTEAGPFTARIRGGTKIVGLDGKRLGGIADLPQGTSVRVYYIVDDGARAQEVDIIPVAVPKTDP